MPLKPIILTLTLLPLPFTAFARSKKPPCSVRSQEIKLARECFSGDMRTEADTGMFLSSDDSSKTDMNYCYNAFVLVQPKKGQALQMTVMKDNEKGQLKIFNYAVSEKTVSASVPKGRAPASRQPVAITFKNLKAECFARHPENDNCSKGVFGFGSSDLPLTIEMSKVRTGFKVEGTTRDQKQIEAAEKSLALDPQSEADPAKSGQWLVQVVKQRLLANATRRLASIKQNKIKARALGGATTQFRYCRMALDGFVHQKKLADPFTPAERQTLDNLEEHLKTTAPIVKR